MLRQWAAAAGQVRRHAIVIQVPEHQQQTALSAPEGRGVVEEEDA
jgi:hypothetical protein